MILSEPDGNPVASQVARAEDPLIAIMGESKHASPLNGTAEPAGKKSTCPVGVSLTIPLMVKVIRHVVDEQLLVVILAFEPCTAADADPDPTKGTAATIRPPVSPRTRRPFRRLRLRALVRIADHMTSPLLASTRD